MRPAQHRRHRQHGDSEEYLHPSALVTPVSQAELGTDRSPPVPGAARGRRDRAPSPVPRWAWEWGQRPIGAVQAPAHQPRFPGPATLHTRRGRSGPGSHSPRARLPASTPTPALALAAVPPPAAPGPRAPPIPLPFSVPVPFLFLVPLLFPVPVPFLFPVPVPIPFPLRAAAPARAARSGAHRQRRLRPGASWGLSGRGWPSSACARPAPAEAPARTGGRRGSPVPGPRQVPPGPIRAPWPKPRRAHRRGEHPGEHSTDCRTLYQSGVQISGKGAPWRRRGKTLKTTEKRKKTKLPRPRAPGTETG